jgi:site-specific DNA recombinase
MARVLGGARLSRKTDESTSLERQTEQITLTAKVRGDELIHITEDSDVSGAISPFAREGLGPWLIDPKKINQWDVLVVAKLDRLTRSLKDFDELVEWMDKNGKVLVSVSESLDLSTSTGRMFANLLAMFAQFERERIGERRREAGIKMRENGWWQGGQPPYGFVPVKVDSHWELREDAVQSGIVYRMAREVIQGKARRAIGRDLTADGIPTPKSAKKWGERTITLILKSEVTVLDDETRGQVLEALDKTKVPWTKRGDEAMLLNVAYCPCGEPLYARRWVHGPSGKLYEYYGCAVKCGERNIPMPELEQAVEDSVLEGFSWVPMFTKNVTAGKSYARDIAAIERKIRALDLDDEEQRVALMAERARLIGLAKNGTKADQTDYQPTGQTVADYWPTLDAAAKRLFLLVNKLRVSARREADKSLSVVIGPDPATMEGGEYFSVIASLGGPDYGEVLATATEGMLAEVAGYERQHGFRINPDGTHTPLNDDGKPAGL